MNFVKTSFLDYWVSAFFKSLSLLDLVIGVLMLVFCLWFIRSWYWRSDETIALLKEIRDELKNKNNT